MRCGKKPFRQVAKNEQQSCQSGLASMDLGYLKDWLCLSTAGEKKKKLALEHMKVYNVFTSFPDSLLAAIKSLIK